MPKADPKLAQKGLSQETPREKKKKKRKRKKKKKNKRI
jgi:hypothetical protein